MPNPIFESSQCSVAWILGADALPGHIDPGSEALKWGSEVRTYAELRSRALSLARALRERGAQPGDRIAAHLLNRGETFELYFACAYAGLTFVPISWRLAMHEVRQIVTDCNPVIVFTQSEVAQVANDGCTGVNTILITLPDDSSGDEYEAMASGAPIPPPFDRTDPHLILYTSGTTGQPKGVMLSHSNITWFAFQQATRYRSMDSSMVMLIVSPTFNTAGVNEQSIPTFLVGGTVVVFPSREWSARRMVAHIDHHQVTHSIVYPSMMEPLLHADGEEPIHLDSVKFLLTGGENVPPGTLTRFRRRWPHIDVMIAYGGTENGAPTTIMNEDLDHHPGSVGRVTLGYALRVQDAEGHPVPQGVVGEIWVAGGSVVSGYWNAPELTASVIRDGWINTGDVGLLDPEGYVYLRGRSRDLIISKGQNIYPAEIENVLSERDDLIEFAVVGVPDDEYGEAVCAVLVVKPEHAVTATEVVDFVRQRIASYKKPRHVVFVDRLPRNAGNKVLKAETTEIVVRLLGLADERAVDGIP